MAAVIDPLERMPHGQLICGTGSAALDFAWDLAHKLVGEEKHSILSLEPEKGVIKLEAAGRIAQFLSLARVTKVRVILVQDAHALNVQTTNAILKSVEEPPEATYFLFVTPDPGLLLPTLRSRLQIVRLKPQPRTPAEDDDEIRAPAVQFLTACLNRDPQAPRTLLDSLEGRESAEKAARIMQEILRDWSVLENAEPLRGWPAWSVRSRVELWRRAHKMEMDLHHNVDRGLVFDNFYYQVPHAMD